MSIEAGPGDAPFLFSRSNTSARCPAEQDKPIEISGLPLHSEERKILYGDYCQKSFCQGSEDMVLVCFTERENQCLKAL